MNEETFNQLIALMDDLDFWGHGNSVVELSNNSVVDLYKKESRQFELKINERVFFSKELFDEKQLRRFNEAFESLMLKNDLRRKNKNLVLFAESLQVAKDKYTKES